jgi:hypothetical protein
MPESIGTFDRLWISPDNTTYTALEFLDGTDFRAAETFMNTGGTRGTRQERAERTRVTQRSVQGQIQCAPNAAELDMILAWAIGPKSGDTFPYIENIPERFARTSRDGTINTYNGLRVNTLTFSASENSPLTCQMALIGIDEASGGTAPAGAINDATSPYVMTDCVLEVGGTEYPFRQISISFNNALEVKYNNSIIATSIRSTSFQVEVGLTLPFGDTTAIYGTGIAGAALSATFTNGNTSLTFEFPCVQTPREGVPLGGRRARDVAWRGVPRKKGSDNLFTITNDSTV